MDEAKLYLLGYRQAEQERLERQADELGHESAWLFDQIGVRDGWQVVEIGCGPRGCLDLLSTRVGETGRVVGVERSDALAKRAMEFVGIRGLTNVQVLNEDARHTSLEAEAFDLATARLVLVNVPHPEEIVSEMVRLVRPGGMIALHEADSTTQRIAPPLEAQDRLVQILNLYARRNGIDRTIGLRVPQLLREAGVVDVTIRPLVHVYPPGHGRRMLLLEFVENARQGLLQENMIRQDELEELTAALREHLENTETMVVSSVFFQVWGRKPI